DAGGLWAGGVKGGLEGRRQKAEGRSPRGEWPNAARHLCLLPSAFCLHLLACIPSARDGDATFPSKPPTERTYVTSCTIWFCGRRSSVRGESCEIRDGRKREKAEGRRQKCFATNGRLPLGLLPSAFCLLPYTRGTPY